jgi:hypothetical protein
MDGHAGLAFTQSTTGLSTKLLSEPAWRGEGA